MTSEPLTQVILCREGTYRIEYAPPTDKQPIDGWNLYEQTTYGWTFIKRYGERSLAVKHAETGSPWTVYA